MSAICRKIISLSIQNSFQSDVNEHQVNLNLVFNIESQQHPLVKIMMVHLSLNHSFFLIKKISKKPFTEQCALVHQPHQNQATLMEFYFMHKAACVPVPLWKMACLLDIVRGSLLSSLHAFACLYQYHIKLPLKTHVSTICQRRRGLACSETTKRHKVSATSEAIPLEISYGVVKWELWNFTACIRVGGSSQSIVSPGLQIPARPQPPFHLRNVLLDNTEVMPVQ